MNTPLEDQVHDALARRVEPLHHSPLGLDGVRTRARRIQRRRRAVAGAAVAAVLAVAIPFGLSATGPAQRSDVGPVTDPSPTVVQDTVLVDPDTADTLDSPPVPLLDVDGPSLVTAAGAVPLPDVLDVMTPYADGWVAAAVYEGAKTLEFLDADLRVTGDPVPTGGLVTSPDGTRVAWTEYTDGHWQAVSAEVSGDAEWTYATLPDGPQPPSVEPVGFVADGVVVRQNDGAGNITTWVASPEGRVRVPGLTRAESASPVTGAVAGLATSGDGTCSAMVDATSGSTLWSTCDYRLADLSPDGAYVVGEAPVGEYGSPTLAVLDARTGTRIVDFEVVLPRRTVGGFESRMVWEDDHTLVTRVARGEDYPIVRLGIDGTVQRVDVDSAGISGLTVAEVR
ncbi:hypothetical protein [Nocardioides zeicaulis]|uniref:WD40 repeat domain-containing protein n=1 Tax=Nocardioides zeicaulis TaxID=1776857 RepID=A0ABV6E6I5_9ACTN